MEKSAEAKTAPVKESMPQKEENPRFVNRLLSLLAYPVAGLSGLWVTAREVHYTAFERAKDVDGNPFFRDIRQKYNRQYTENAEAFMKTPRAKEDLHAWRTKDFTIRAEHSEAVGTRLEEMGMSRKWFSLKYLPATWEYISASKKSKAVIEGLTVTGIAIGAILAVTNSRTLIELFSKDHNEKENSR